jgi:hypothetical protein
VVNAFGAQLVGYLHDVARGEYNRQVSAALARLKALEQQINALSTELQRATGRDLAQFISQQLTTLLQTRMASNNSVAVLVEKPPRYRLIEASVAVRLESPHDDRSNTTLIVLGLFAALVLGFGLAFLLRRRSSPPAT